MMKTADNAANKRRRYLVLAGLVIVNLTWILFGVSSLGIKRLYDRIFDAQSTLIVLSCWIDFAMAVVSFAFLAYFLLMLIKGRNVKNFVLAVFFILNLVLVPVSCFFMVSPLSHIVERLGSEKSSSDSPQ